MEIKILIYKYIEIYITKNTRKNIKLLYLRLKHFGKQVW